VDTRDDLPTLEANRAHRRALDNPYAPPEARACPWEMSDQAGEN
jgi:hypothetical protein